ncbi:ABC transporter substrate-binding protein [Curtobacterium luteum]|uniref:ABC transporter substrate-binding protein n=1 Tax=Curtobacterium luteum TaxID=33881 RepID=UPI003807C06F
MPIRRLWSPRVLLSAAALTAAALAMTACSSGGGTTARPSADGHLVFGISTDTTEMVPWLATSTQSLQVLGQLYSPLLNQQKNLQPTAGLADLPKVSDDGLTYTFTLRKGVTFADGTTLDSADVKYSYDTIMNPDTKAASASYFASVASVAAPDPQTVVITLKTPDASFIAGLSNTNTAILPSDVPLDTLETKPDGSGPFTFVSRKANQSITLKRNADYYQGTPKLAELQFRIIEDDKSMVSALRSGAVDMALFDNSVTAKTAVSNSVKTTAVSELGYHALQLRADAPALADKNLRLAIQCAISRKQVLDTAALGAGDITGPITSPAFKSDTADQPCPTRNVTKAKAYLKQAGKADGFTLNTIVPSGIYSSAADEAQSVQAQLKDVGITMKIETLDSSAYVDRWLAGDFDAAIAFNGGSVDPNTMYGRYFTSTGNFNTVAGYHSATLDKLFAEGKTTTDASKRKSIYQQISTELTDNAAWVWLYTGRQYIAQNTAVSGFVPKTNAGLDTLWQTAIAD